MLRVFANFQLYPLWIETQAQAEVDDGEIYSDLIDSIQLKAIIPSRHLMMLKVLFIASRCRLQSIRVVGDIIYSLASFI